MAASSPAPRGLYFGKIDRRALGADPKVKWVHQNPKNKGEEPTTSGKSETITRRAGLTFAKGKGQRKLLYIIKEVTKEQVIENHGNPEELLEQVS